MKNDERIQDLGIKLNMSEWILHKCIFHDHKVDYVLSKNVKARYYTELTEHKVPTALCMISLRENVLLLFDLLGIEV